MGIKARIVAHDPAFSVPEDPTELPKEATAYVKRVQTDKDGNVTEVVVTPLVTIHFERDAVPEGHCPDCGEKASSTGILVGPPMNQQIRHARHRLADMLGKSADEIIGEQYVPFVLAMHGGYIAQDPTSDCATCRSGYLVRVHHWPETSIEVTD